MTQLAPDRYRCDTCGTVFAFMSLAVCCELLHPAGSHAPPADEEPAAPEPAQ